jgi:hypothetical protein
MIRLHPSNILQSQEANGNGAFRKMSSFTHLCPTEKENAGEGVKDTEKCQAKMHTSFSTNSLSNSTNVASKLMAKGYQPSHAAEGEQRNSSMNNSSSGFQKLVETLVTRRTHRFKVRKVS